MEVRLRFYRFMESIFSYPAAYFGDLADGIDTELHQTLKDAMHAIKLRRDKCPVDFSIEVNGG